MELRTGADAPTDAFGRSSERDCGAPMAIGVAAVALALAAGGSCGRGAILRLGRAGVNGDAS